MRSVAPRASLARIDPILMTQEESARILSIAFFDLKSFEEAKKDNVSISAEYSVDQIAEHLEHFFRNLKIEIYNVEAMESSFNFLMQKDLSFFRVFICDAIQNHEMNIIPKLIATVRDLEKTVSKRAPVSMAMAGAGAGAGSSSDAEADSFSLVQRVNYLSRESFGSCGDRVSNGLFDIMVAIKTDTGKPLNKMSATELLEHARIGAMLKGMQDFALAENRRIEEQSPGFSEHIETALAIKASMAYGLIGVSTFSAQFTGISGVDGGKMSEEVERLRKDSLELSYKYMLEDALISQTPIVQAALNDVDDDKYITLSVEAGKVLEGEPDFITKKMAEFTQQLRQERQLIALRPFFRSAIEQDKKSVVGADVENESKESEDGGGHRLGLTAAPPNNRHNGFGFYFRAVPRLRVPRVPLGRAGIPYPERTSGHPDDGEIDNYSNVIINPQIPPASSVLPPQPAPAVNQMADLRSFLQEPEMRHDRYLAGDPSVHPAPVQPAVRPAREPGCCNIL